MEAKSSLQSQNEDDDYYDYDDTRKVFLQIWGDEADDGGLQYGLIADEVEAVNQDLCFYDDGKLSGVHYDRMMSPLIKAVQDQKKEIDALKAEVAALKSA